MIYDSNTYTQKSLGYVYTNLYPGNLTFLNKTPARMLITLLHYYYLSSLKVHVTDVSK